MTAMSHHPNIEHVGRAGWFAAGALAASVAFVVLLVAGDYFKTASKPEVAAKLPALVIEGN